MDDPYAALGKRIQHLRQKSGVTQEQLAEKADLSLKHLGELERGRGNPTLSSLGSLAVALGITLAEMFDFEHERLSTDEIKRELQTIINHASDEDCRVFYRLITALTK